MAAQLYERSFAVAPNPHEAQRCFWMWYAWRPQRRQRTWLGVWNLPFDDVPLDTEWHLLRERAKLAPLFNDCRGGMARAAAYAWVPSRGETSRGVRGGR